MKIPFFPSIESTATTLVAACPFDCKKKKGKCCKSYKKSKMCKDCPKR